MGSKFASTSFLAIAVSLLSGIAGPAALAVSENDLVFYCPWDGVAEPPSAAANNEYVSDKPFSGVFCSTEHKVAGDASMERLVSAGYDAYLDYILYDTPTLSAAIDNNTLTLIVWCRAELLTPDVPDYSDRGTMGIYDRWDQTNADKIIFQTMTRASTGIAWCNWHQSDGSVANAGSPTAVPFGEGGLVDKWCFFASVYDGVNQTVTNYLGSATMENLNSVSIGSPEGVTGDLKPVEWFHSVVVGRRGGALFNGQIDETAMFAQALTADEIETLFEAGKRGVSVTEMLDNLAIQQCGDPGTVYLDSDLNQDCYVDWSDFSLFADPWLQCTDPANTNCDPYWQD